MNNLVFYIGLLAILTVTNSECTNKKDKDCEDLTKLENAIRQNKKNTVKFLTLSSKKINSKNKDQETPIMLCVKHGNLELLKLIFKEGGNLNYEKAIKTPLNKQRYYQVCPNLRKRSSYLYFETPLSMALNTKNLGIVTFLIENGAEWTKIKKDGFSLLQSMVKESQSDLFAEEVVILFNKKELYDKGQDPISLAIQDNNLRLVKLLLKDEEHQRNRGRLNGPLEIALREHNMEALKLLFDGHNAIDANAVHYCTNVRGTLLTLATNLEDKGAIEFLLSKGADLNKKLEGIDLNTPLCEAVKKNNIELAEFLLDKGADPNLANSEKRTPIMFAKNEKMASLLLNKGANIQANGSYGSTPIMFAIQDNNIEVVKFLLKHVSNLMALDHQGKTVFDYALESKNQEIIDLIEPNVPPKSKFMIYVKRRSIDKAKEVIDNELDKALVNDKTNDSETPLILVLRTFADKSFDLVKSLISKGADVNLPEEKRGCTPLIIAAELENTDIINLLLENGGRESINTKNKEMDTPLTIAVQTNNVDVVKIFLENGADANNQKKDGMTPLLLNAQEEDGDIEITKLLLQYGAKQSVNAQNEDGVTALMWSVENRNLDMMKLLLDSGAKDSINVQDKYGDTALIRSSLAYNADITKVLLGNGADKSLRNKQGNTALDVAQERYNLKTVKVLKNSAPKKNSKKKKG